MANVATTTYIVEGEMWVLEELKERIDDLPFLVNFQVLAMHFTEDHQLLIIVDSNWKENSEMRHQLEGEFPEVKFWYDVEVEGLYLWGTNDKEGRFFPYRFMAINEEFEEQIFITREEALAYGQICCECMMLDDDSNDKDDDE